MKNNSSRQLRLYFVVRDEELGIYEIASINPVSQTCELHLVFALNML